MSRTLFAATILAAVALPMATPARADEAAPNATARIGARLWPDGSRLDGKIALDITNDTPGPLASIPLWLYPNRFADPERGVDARTRAWLYPGGASPGSMAVGAAAWNGEALPPAALRPEPMPAGGSPAGLADAVLVVRLPAPLPPGRTGTLTLEFTVEIPERRGRFGRSGGTVSLAADWFPRPFADLTGARPGLPPRRIRARLDLALPAGRGAVIADRVFPVGREARTLSATGLEGEAIPVVVMDRMEISTRALPWGEAIHVGRETRPRRPGWEDTRGDDPSGLPRGIPPLGGIDFAGRALEVAERTAAILRELTPSCPLPRRLVMVEIPAWDRLTQAGPGMVLVSDRTWRVLEFDVVLAFHDAHLARTVAAELARGAVAGDGTARWQAAELAAAEAAERFRRSAPGGGRSMRDLLGFAGFLPRIDNLLYAPQIPFREVYVPAYEEDDPLRDEPWRFMNDRADGRRLRDKLVDRLGGEAAARLAADLLAGRGDLAGLLRPRLGQETAAFLAQWTGPYPSVNYRVAAVRDANLGDGRMSHVVEIARDGDRVREPVTVRLEDEDGRSEDVTWDGDGQRGKVEWFSLAPVENVRIDPGQRLIEDPALTDGHPLADNDLSLPWRLPLLTRFVIWGDAVAGEPHLDLGVALRREHDLTHSVHLSGTHTPRSSGGSLYYLRHFGPKRTLNARSWYAGPILGATRYHETERAGPEIPDEGLVAATMGSVGAMIGQDDRAYFPDPDGGLAASASATWSFGRADDGRELHVGGFGARVFGLASPALGHTFALYGGLTAVAGDPVAAELSSLSNRQVLRGFELDETYGRLGVYAAAEYRHDLLDLSRLPKIIIIRLDHLQGALFVAGGTISWPGGYDGMFSPERLFTEAGYGLRIHALTFGVSQNLLAVDLAVPLTPLDRTYEAVLDDGSRAERARAPFKLTLGITQTY